MIGRVGLEAGLGRAPGRAGDGQTGTLSLGPLTP